MGLLRKKKDVASSLEDLSYAQVESSHLFGFTNVSGKILAVASLAALAAGATGIAQGLGYMGPVAEVSMNFMAGLAVAGASVATGLTGYWLGNFDDKKIRAHNRDLSSSFNSSARHKVYNRIENALAAAISAVEYDPGEKHLPYDALGYAVLLTDEKIAALPAHVQVDIYRTQLDLELHRKKGLVSANTIEGLDLEARIMGANATMEKKAEDYRQARDRVRAKLQDGTLVATPATAQEFHEDSGISDSFVSDNTGSDIADAAGDFLRISMPGRGGGSGGGFKGFGGGRSGGGGGGGSWSDAAPRGGGNAPAFIPVPVGGSSSAPGQAFFSAGTGSGSSSSLMAESSAGGLDWSSGSGSGGSGSGGGFSLGDLDVDEDSAGPLLVIAGIAAVAAAASVAGFSLWKNFGSKADQPVLADGVRLPMLARSLATAEKDVRAMYAPA